MADLLRPKKKLKVDDLSTITLGYIKDKSSKIEMISIDFEFYSTLVVVQH